MAESPAFARRTFLGGTPVARLAAGINAGDTAILGDDLSTWASMVTNGNTRVMINRGGANAEEIEVSAVAANQMTASARGVGGTTAASHSAGETLEIVSSPRDFDEANTWVAELAAAASAANQVIVTDADNSLTGVDVAASRLFGRKAAGNVDDLTPAEVVTILTSSSELGEYIQDIVGALIAAGAGITVSYNDAGAVETIGIDTAVIDERARDAVGTAINVSTGITKTVDDAGDTITLAGNVLCVVKAADESVTSSTALQDDDALLLALAANTDYVFRAVLRVASASGTPNFKYALTVPAAATLLGFGYYVEYDGAGTVDVDSALDGVLTSSGDTATQVVKSSSATDATSLFVIIEGTVRNGANAGNLTLQWAQQTSNGTATTVKAGSSLKVVKES